MSNIDYSKYTIDELFDVKKNISPDSPNYALLLSELENRKEEVNDAVIKSEEEAFSLAEHRVKIIGYFQLVASIVILYFFINSLLGGGASIEGTVYYLFFITLNAIAGFTAVKERYKWYWVSIFNQILQIPSIAIGSISANYSGLGGVHIGLSWGEAYELILSAPFSPGFFYREYTATLPTQSFAIDLLALVYIAALLTVGEVKSTANKQLNQDK
ncbi:hypothetical protein L1077_22095 [Pseudoalteromonas luteoviolacea]|uniref:hypothetical protein n=1 Tax=Pseudoalteromonas luteoviolacea TaxID=43657 RepID=UPI001F2C7EF6|nr:hypothetical protein [Pseudoalteromonas luteoviolacea]MCF6442122.1 hypothetical protein [Pseudoalteromonas luteoviolacea]